jgi:hypothetical protein
MRAIDGIRFDFFVKTKCLDRQRRYFEWARRVNQPRQTQFGKRPRVQDPPDDPSAVVLSHGTKWRRLLWFDPELNLYFLGEVRAEVDDQVVTIIESLKGDGLDEIRTAFHVFLYAMLLKQAKDETTALRLVLTQPTTAGSEFVSDDWPSRSASESRLEWYRSIVLRLMEGFREGTIVPKTGPHCRGCAFSSGCDVGQRYLRRRKGRLEASRRRGA